MPNSQTAASVPPATITSASPKAISRAASPMACTPVAQAVTAEWFGPLKPYRIETWPEARLTRAEGIKNGESRRVRPAWTSEAASWMVSSPPIPLPIMTPVRHCASSVSATQPLSSTASAAATTASWMKRSIFFWSLIGIHSFRSSLPSAFAPLGTWPATLAGRSLRSKDWMADKPLSPFTSRFHTWATPNPKGLTIPMPVTTTRRGAKPCANTERYSRNPAA